MMSKPNPLNMSKDSWDASSKEEHDKPETLSSTVADDSPSEAEEDDSSESDLKIVSVFKSEAPTHADGCPKESHGYRMKSEGSRSSVGCTE
jgi:hypothetical protein